jgi:hypothetical protein
LQTKIGRQYAASNGIALITHYQNRNPQLEEFLAKLNRENNLREAKKKRYFKFIPYVALTLLVAATPIVVQGFLEQKDLANTEVNFPPDTNSTSTCFLMTETVTNGTYNDVI